MHFDRLSLIELLDALSTREASCVELMTATLGRIDATRAQLNAVVSQRPREELIADAETADGHRAAGDARPLEGVPLGVKDLEDVAGMVTSMGSRVFRDSLAEADSTQVARLRAAGAIVVGKTNTPEFGFTAITKNPLFGVTRSPWNLERTPGGSSGGSAAVLTGGVLPLVTSSDGGGSIRIPASFTGAFGLKPSQGRVPRGPMKAWDYGSTAVYGPLTRTVADAALFLDVVAGPSPCDPGSLPHPGLSYREVLESGLPASTRIAWSADLSYAGVQADVARVATDAATVFEAAGRAVEPLEEHVPGGPPVLTAAWGALGNFLLAGQLHEPLRQHRAEMTHSFAEALEHSWEMTPEAFGAAGARARPVESLVRRGLRPLRSAADADRALRPAARPRALPHPHRGPGAGAGGSRVVHDPVQHVGPSGRHGACRSVRCRATHRTADRRSTPPRRPGSEGRAAVRTHAALAPRLAHGTGCAGVAAVIRRVAPAPVTLTRHRGRCRPDAYGVTVTLIAPLPLSPAISKARSISSSCTLCESSSA